MPRKATPRTAASALTRRRPGSLTFERPLSGVDLVIFTVRDDALAVLLTRRPDQPGEPCPGQWALPGGFIDVAQDATLEACARRKLQEKTGIASPYLEQLGSWGGRDRDPRGWSATHVYFALMPSNGIEPRAGGTAADARWHALHADHVPERLAFDHAEILAAAVDRLRSKVEYTSLPAFLLPEEFTLVDLQRVYEIVLGRPVNKSALRTRVMAADLLTEVPRQRSGPTRPAQLYRLKDRQHPVFFPRTFSPRGD
jgi:ADP-ribose pyrophosphatase YjhB (NUDIX family)